MAREYDVVADGRLAAAPVREQFSQKAPDQVVKPEVKSPQTKEPRVPEVPKLELNPPSPMGRGPEVELAPTAPSTLAQRKQAAQEREQGQRSKELSEQFTRAKFRSLAERRFEAASKSQDVGRER